MSLSVMKFAIAMEKELINNSHKTGWSDLSPQWCINRIRQETDELERAIKSGKSLDEIRSECADVANFAMMIFNNLEDAPNESAG